MAAAAGEEPASARLKISEIFFSIQGEGRFSGLPTVFIRLTGCPLRCQYCDTAYAFTGGEWRTLPEILENTTSYSTPYVCVTGGEPLAQSRCLTLLSELCDADYHVSLETSGAIDIAAVDRRVSRVLDIKTPGSAEFERNLWTNLDDLTEADTVKLVICDRNDYEWARSELGNRLQVPCPVFFSPSYEQLEANTLADWILEDQLPVRLQLQMHKLLWGDVPGR